MQEKSNTSSLKGMLLFGIMIVAFIVIQISGNSKNKRLESVCTGTAVGWVSDSTRSRGRDSVVISYQINNEVYHSDRIDDAGDKYKAGAIIVHYNPNDVTECYYGDKPDAPLPAFYSILFVVVVLAEIYMVIDWLRTRKEL